MNVSTTEALIDELLSNPREPLGNEQKQIACDYAAGLYVGRIDDLKVDVDMALRQLQGMHVLSHRQVFFIDYFDDEAGKTDARRLGIVGMDRDTICKFLTDVTGMIELVGGEERKAIAKRSGDWARGKMIAQLARPGETDIDFQPPSHLSVNYEPDKLLAKAAAVRAYRRFYAEASCPTAFEPDQRLAEAKQALIGVYVGRLNSLAATDVFPGLLSFEEQLTRSTQNRQVEAWTARLRAVAPVLGDIHDLDEQQRVQMRDVYVRHLDAIRQGASYELDEVRGDEALLFSNNALHELLDATQSLSNVSDASEPTALARALQDVSWGAEQIKAFVETILRTWGMLSAYPASWQEVDDRDGFAPDEKFQVITTPRRANMSVDSTRRIVNIPEGDERPLVGRYPAGVLPLVAHELSHVLQSYADYELGRQIPLASIKGRRYRILREAGGVYQEKIMGRDYFGTVRGPNGHYLRAYVAKMEGKSRIQVARVFYESVKGGQQLSPEEDEQLRAFAVDRTARLYRHGGQNSQVLDYVEQSVVCDILMQRLEPEKVNAFLLGSTSFSIEDSALLHKFGLLALPTHVALSPAHAVMKVFLEQFNHS